MFARMLTCNLGAGKLESCGPAPENTVKVPVETVQIGSPGRTDQMGMGLKILK